MKHINANILIRLFGIICIFLGSLGATFVVVSWFLAFAGMPRGMVENLSYYATQSLVSSPIWILGGFIVIKFSRQLAALAEKGSDSA